MLGRIHLKRTIKRTAGCLSVAGRPFVQDTASVNACILVYHRVAEIGFVDPHRDDWNVPPATFAQQVESLRETANLVALEELPGLLHRDDQRKRALVCLTFDDGYANFVQNALPVLKRFNVPATFFVPTSVIGSTDPMPFDRWATENRDRVSDAVWRAATWSELEECLDSGLVSIGSHSHHHLNGCQCTGEQFVEEASRSREILAGRFGQDCVRSYAYPYGSRRLGQVPGAYVDAVRDAGYELAVTTDLGMAHAGDDPMALPRIEAHPLDGPAVIRAKASGSLAPYRLTDRMRKGVRR